MNTKSDKNTLEMDGAMLGAGNNPEQETGEHSDLNEEPCEISEEETEEAEKLARFEGYERDEDGRVIYPLEEPVTIEAGSGRHTWKQLSIKKPKGRELRASGAGKNQTDQGLILLARCIKGGTQKLVDELSAEDIDGASEILGFLSRRKPRASN